MTGSWREREHETGSRTPVRRASVRRYNAPSRGPDMEVVKGEQARFVQASKQCRHPRQALESPAVSRRARDQVIRRLANLLEIAPLVRNFLYVVSQRGPLAKIRTIVEEFESLSDERRGIARVVAISAMTYDECSAKLSASNVGRIPN